MAGPSSRRIRRALLAIYLAVAACFVAILVRGVVLSIVNEMGMGPRRAGSCGARSPESCREQLVDLRRQLDVKLAEIQHAGLQGERLWDEWAAGWRRELASVSAECCLDQEEVPEGFRALAQGERGLRELQGLYTTHVVQYAREIGDKAESVDRELGVSRSTEAPTPPPRSAPGRP